MLPGGQAQYIRVPKAGGTLFVLQSSISPNASAPFLDVETFKTLPDPTLLLLADILPTGLFVALQALSHPKLLPFTVNMSWPNTMDSILYPHISASAAPLTEDDRVLTIGVIGLGPVGLVINICRLHSFASTLTHHFYSQCATLALLDLLEHRQLHPSSRQEALYLRHLLPPHTTSSGRSCKRTARLATLVAGCHPSIPDAPRSSEE